jgi:hypothetical protein
MPLVALVVMVVVARALKTHLEVLQLQILVVEAEAEGALTQTLAEMVAQVLSSFVMLAHSAALAAQ